MSQPPGTKLDDGKPRVGLVVTDFAAALLAVAKVATFGAQKYSDHGWRQVPNAEQRYNDAMYRHLLAYARGEEHDLESGQPHLAHAAWCLLAVLEKYEESKGDTAVPTEGKEVRVSGVPYPVTIARTPVVQDDELGYTLLT